MPKTLLNQLLLQYIELLNNVNNISIVVRSIELDKYN